ncbi:PEP/pyruvate-binding domain-containing protein [Arthrobacter bambusae]|uniref:PEP/pyruvate-binding domain-containing protein n=1 Tax=Arthrobacter bambusae TaxID=1338426 RepID=UPI00278195DA|nr:PEP/pyruvate-binding domain-containing protein [Arthrobacter bambusae]MDQ0212098.1 pyruvate,water dikinase [Arthrobacter bambusae]MDQ0237816.1 pyruvate,water dikinase [Arthrobacter bambusae]
MTYIYNFADVEAADVAVAGGKGVGLGNLVRAGLPVPPGFVLATAAYGAFVDANGIQARIQELAALTSEPAPQDYEDASAAIRALFIGGTMPAAIAYELAAAYERLRDGDGDRPDSGDRESADAPVAVRSSATAEDLASASFAGQQETYLNVRGAEALDAAVIDCWSSLWTARAMAYRDREGIAPGDVRLAVVVQRMVEAEAAGVMFTANPANGRRDQIAISAAWGLGESVVSGTVTTDDLVVEAGTGRVLSRRTAGKEVMTVYADHAADRGSGVVPDQGVPDQGGTTEQPVPAALRNRAVLDDGAAAALARYGTRIADYFGTPQDIEWARADGDFFMLQSRPITALPEPVADTPDTWPLPYPKGLYFRASIVEQLPDPLSPLFADLIDGSVTRSLKALMNEAVGSEVVRDGDVGLPTINGYAYYYYRTMALWRVMGKSPAAMLALVRGKAHMGVAGWREFSHPRYEEVLKDWSAKSAGELSGEELLEGVRTLLDAGTVYYTAVQSIIPVAATSEMAFRAFYDKLIRRAGDPPAETFLLGYDSEPIRAEKSLYDLAAWAREVEGLAPAILNQPTAALAESQRNWLPPAGMDPALWQQWRPRFQAHLDRFGHAVYNLDFLSPVPADDPSVLLDTVKFYLRGHGNDPHERQRLSAARREDQTDRIVARLGRTRLGRSRRAPFIRLLRWAQKSAPVREDALADVGLAWPLIRRMLFELGQRLVYSGVIARPADVFWLRQQELQSAVEFGLAAPQPSGTTEPLAPVAVAITGAARPVRADVVEERKMLWRGQAKAAAPQLLPETRWMKDAFESMMPARSQDQPSDVIKGVGASAGRVSAPARVLTGPQDFGQMAPGDVLVARITTPAWTSLFAMASAVVTDVGGPLSHSSIVAREYGIPAVLGTGVATQRLTSGQQITVDGDAGTVTVEHPAG